MSYRRIVSGGKVWVEDNCREELEQEIVKADTKLQAQSEEIARMHALLRDRLPVEAPTATKGGAT